MYFKSKLCMVVYYYLSLLILLYIYKNVKNYFVFFIFYKTEDKSSRDENIKLHEDD